MKKIKILALKLAALVLLMAGTISCEKKDLSDAYTKTGIVAYFSPDEPDHCKDYMLVLEDKFYKPDKLPDKFKTDSLKIKITYRITEEKYNCGFGGYVPVINILKIEKL